MRLGYYVRLWLLISALLAFEAYALNLAPGLSLIAWLQKYIPQMRGPLSPRAGGMISLWYGWIGLTLMLLTNLYVMRKRSALLRKIGSGTGWLNFHIFCGLMGPTFILFHTNFKVGGLVAISFWCMVISFASGIVGRYFFVQSGRKQVELEQDLSRHESVLGKYAAGIAPGQIDGLKIKAIRLAGAHGFDETSFFALPNALFSSMIGDLRLRFGLKKITSGFPPGIKAGLHGLALTQRRMLYLAQFRQLMGYWHSFHTPFAVFMYLIAAIHIVVALLFRVSQAA